MSRVIRSTLRPAAAGGFVLLALGLSACGGDSPSSASSNAPAEAPAATAAPGATSAAAAGTTPVSAQVSKGASGASAPKLSSSQLAKIKAAKIAVTTEGASAVKQASSKKLSDSDLKAQITTLRAALNGLGLDVTTSPSKGGHPVVLRTPARINVMLFTSPKAGAEGAVGYLKLLRQSKIQTKLARSGNAIVVLIGDKPGKALPDDSLAKFAAAQKAIEQSAGV